LAGRIEIFKIYVAAGPHFSPRCTRFRRQVVRRLDSALFYDKLGLSIRGFFKVYVDPSRQTIGTIEYSVARYKPDAVTLPFEGDMVDPVVCLLRTVVQGERALKLSAKNIAFDSLHPHCISSCIAAAGDIKAKPSTGCKQSRNESEQREGNHDFNKRKAPPTRDHVAAPSR